MPTKAWSITAGAVPAMRLSTVLAAWAPSGPAAWQLIRSGWPDGAAQSPAATMRGVVDAGQRLVGEQPAQRVGAQSAGRGQLRHAEARRPDGHRARSAPRRRRTTTASGATSVTTSASSTVTPCLAQPLGDRIGGPARDSDGASCPPHTSVTLRPCSASSAAVSMPVSPAPTTVTGASGCSSSSLARSRCAYSNSAMG